MHNRFEDRQSAGRALAQKLQKYKTTPDLLIIGLPRGGVVVAYEVAIALGAQLDVLVVRKLGAPYQPELAMGAIAEGGIVLLNDDVVNYLSIPREFIKKTVDEQLVELQRREKLYRNGRNSPRVAERPVIVVDDGLATGATMKVALRAVRRNKPSMLIAAVPVGAVSTCMELKEEADEVICLLTPEPFYAVGNWFENFEQTTDLQVSQLLLNAYRRNSEQNRSSQQE
ncbi:MAG TPA: phosphoribosyltransferase [Chitinispirillaceae bacterium]|nr:phosphoribosyltransferase [Chitinispirillaceae bacterium]